MRAPTVLAAVAAVLLAGCAEGGPVGGSDPAASTGTAPTGTGGPGTDGTGTAGPGAGTRIVLWDGGAVDGWRQAGPGGFDVVSTDDGPVLQSRGGLGLLWYAERSFGDVTVELDWRVHAATDNSGVFVRFPDPGGDPGVAIAAGYEVQVNDNPGGDPQKTGAVYNERAPSAANSRPVGEWNHYRIDIAGQRYRVFLNGLLVNDYTGHRATVGDRGFVGIQNHDPTSLVQYRRITARPASG